jgi:multiple sugar transport system substrate-binding protein
VKPHTRRMAPSLLLALALTLLAACSGPTLPAASSTPAATAAPGGAATAPTAGATGDVRKIPVEDGASLTFLVNGDTTEQQLYQDGLNRFQQIFPNVKVTFQVNNDNYDTLLQAKFAAGQPPDVLLLPPEDMGAFAPQGLLLALDPYMAQAGVSPDDYYPPLLQVFQLNGKTYGLPKDYGDLALFVNTDLAQQAGVDPASLQSWADLQAAAAKLTTGDGPGKTYGMCLNPDIERVGAQMLQLGNPLVSNNQATFNDPTGVQAMTFWVSFQTAGTGQHYQELGKTWCGESFASGQTAMVYEGGWLVPFMTDPENGGTGVHYTAVPFPLPPGGQQATWTFTNAFGASAATKYPNATAALVLFLTGYANEQALVPSGVAQPSLKALANDPYFAQNPNAAVLVQQTQYGHDVNVALGGPQKVGDVVDAINNQAIEPIYLGTAAIPDALNQAAQQVDQILAGS